MDFVFKIENIQNTYSYNLRGNELILPSVNIYKFKQSILYQVIFNWNKLPHNLKSIKSLHGFKKNLKMSFIDRY